MSTVSSVKRSVICAICLALGVVLRQLLQFIPGADGWCAPMQLTVLLCALFCGWGWGTLCGMLAPFLSWLLCASPSPALLPQLTLECMAIGALGAFLMGRSKEKGGKKALFISSLSALLCGRLLGGLLGGLIFGPGLSGLVFWCLSYTALGLPALIIALLLVPRVYSTLEELM